MKTNLSKFFSIRKLSKEGLGIRIKRESLKAKETKRQVSEDLLEANASLWQQENRFRDTRVKHIDSSFTILTK